MEYRFDITLTEQDYIAYNQFHAFDSPQGKKQRKRNKMMLSTAILALIVAMGLILRDSIVFALYDAALAVYLAVCLLFYRKIAMLILKWQIKRMKKEGKLPYEPAATMEFYADHFVEITPAGRMERQYSSIERICIVPDRFVLLYLNTVTAVILPISQLRQQTQLEGFLDFLSEKCPGEVCR